MFARLPQMLPFTFPVDEPKLAFRSQPGGIAKLATTRVSASEVSREWWFIRRLLQNIPETDSYWNQVSDASLYPDLD